jgi:hypothetical protein
VQEGPGAGVEEGRPHLVGEESIAPIRAQHLTERRARMNGEGPHVGLGTRPPDHLAILEPERRIDIGQALLEPDRTGLDVVAREPVHALMKDRLARLVGGGAVGHADDAPGIAVGEVAGDVAGALALGTLGLEGPERRVVGKQHHRERGERALVGRDDLAEGVDEEVELACPGLRLGVGQLRDHREPRGRNHAPRGALGSGKSGAGEAHRGGEACEEQRRTRGGGRAHGS